MSDLTVVHGDAIYTDLPKRMSALDARILVRQAGLGEYADSFEPRAGATRVIWAREPSGAQLDRLAQRLEDSDD